MKERAVIVCAWEADVFTMKELCEHFGVSQKTGFKWVKRYREEDVYIRARSDDSDDSSENRRNRLTWHRSKCGSVYVAPFRNS